MGVTIQPSTAASPQITYTEIALGDQGSSPKEYAGHRWEADRILRCAWEDRWALKKQLLGFVEPYIISASGQEIRITAPEPYPYGYGYQPMYCVDAEIVPEVGYPGATRTDTLAWDYAIIRAHYASPQAGNGTFEHDVISLYWTENMTPSAQFMTFAHRGQMFWSDGSPIPPQSAPPFCLKRNKWMVTQQKVPLSIALPSALFTYQGGINSSPISSHVYPGIIFPAKSLLYDGFHVEDDRQSDGSAALKITMEFTAANIPGSYGWNSFPRIVPGTPSATLEFQQIYNAKTSGVPIDFYEQHDLRQLLGWITI